MLGLMLFIEKNEIEIKTRVHVAFIKQHLKEIWLII
jgi:hypothetical protein